MSNISKETAIWMANIVEALEEAKNPLEHVYFTTVGPKAYSSCNGISPSGALSWAGVL